MSLDVLFCPKPKNIQRLKKAANPHLGEATTRERCSDELIIKILYPIDYISVD